VGRREYQEMITIKEYFIESILGPFLVSVEKKRDGSIVRKVNKFMMVKIEM
jgi:hypothetical protein